MRRSRRPAGAAVRRASSAAWSSSISSRSGWPARTARSCAGPVGGDGGAGRVLRPAGDHQRPGAGGQRGGHARRRSGPRRRPARPIGRSPSAATRSSRLAQPGSSTATASPGRRWAASSRSMPSSAPPVTVSSPAGTPSAASRSPGQLGQLGQHAGAGVPDGGEPARRRAPRGAGRAAAAAGGRARRRRGRGRRAAAGAAARSGGPADRRPGPDPGAVAAGGLDQAALAQLLVRLGHGGRADAQLGGERPDRRAAARPAAARRSGCRTRRWPKSRRPSPR